MKLTKQQQVLGGVMFLGLIAVGVDRLMPRAGAATEAGDSANLLVDHHAPVTATTAATISRTHSFNQRLAAAAAQANPQRHAFELATVWQSAPQPVVVVPLDSAADEFANNHRLSATLARGDRSGAVIDGKLVLIGQAVEGFKLVSVTGRSVTLSNGRMHVVLNQISR